MVNGQCHVMCILPQFFKKPLWALRLGLPWQVSQLQPVASSSSAKTLHSAKLGVRQSSQPHPCLDPDLALSPGSEKSPTVASGGCLPPAQGLAADPKFHFSPSQACLSKWKVQDLFSY